MLLLRGAEKDTRKSKTTSGGVCLGGFREEGSEVLFAFKLDQPLREARLLLRYAREDPDAAHLRLLLAHPGGTLEKALILAPTGGWGYDSFQWKWAEFDVGPLPAGETVLGLQATRGPNRDNLNLDGFYLIEKGRAPPMNLEADKVEKERFEACVPMEALTGGDKSHWFGYYDKLQFDPSDRYVLGMEVDFDDRAPQPEDTIRLGMMDRAKGNKWIEIGQTCAWCWQQGCMLQWLPGSSSRVIYNDRRGGKFVSIVKDVFSGETRILPRPVYTVSPDGKTALSINFARLNQTRPGYGYAGLPDAYEENLHPKEDGIFRLDLETGEAELIVSLDSIASHERTVRSGEGEHYFNHLLFNSDGSRFIFLHRWYQEAKRNRGWLTRMFTANRDGSALFCVDPHGHTSHFIWRNPEQILCWTWTPKAGSAYHLFTDQSEAVEIVGKGILTENGHMSYSPDGKWILTDTYPHEGDRMMTLMVFRPEDNKLVKLGRFHLDPRYRGQMRCDLHPRWSRRGKFVCIDSLHTGRRKLYLLDVSGIVE